LMFGDSVKPGSLGCRKTFADVATAVAAHLALPDASTRAA
jgi:phosphopentomutase